MGYHIRNIQRGTLGEWSKVSEEIEEIIDALEQNLKPMVLIELCDCLGAIHSHANSHANHEEGFNFENWVYVTSTERNQYQRYTDLDVIIEKFKLDLQEADIEENHKKLINALISFVEHYFMGSVTIADLVRFSNKTIQVRREECAN